MLSNATLTAWINQHQRKGSLGEEDDRSRTAHTGSGQRGAGTKGRREVDADFRQRAAPPAGKSLAGANRPGASVRVGPSMPMGALVRVERSSSPWWERLR